MIQADDFLNTAKSLVKKDAHESHLRTAISRAYYACYHAANKVAKSRLGYSEPTCNKAHWSLAEHLINFHDAEIKVAGVQLRGLHRQRIKADYKLHESMTANDATLTLAQAAMLISAVKNFK